MIGFLRRLTWVLFAAIIIIPVLAWCLAYWIVCGGHLLNLPKLAWLDRIREKWAGKEEESV